MDEPQSVAQRLDAEIQRQFGTVYKFQKELAARNKQRKPKDRIKGTSTPSIHAYLKGGTDGSVPGVDFLQVAAEILGVRPSWLAFGTGPRSDEEERIERSKAYAAMLERPTPYSAAIDEVQQRGFQSNSRQNAALERFQAKLDASDFPGSPWAASTDRVTVLAAALEFLVVADVAAKVAMRVDRDADMNSATSAGYHDLLFRATSSSPGWYVMWSDAILHAFAFRVKGMGERTGEFWDSHAPAAGRAGDLDPEDYRM